MLYENVDLNMMNEIAREIANKLKKGDTIFLEGTLGAGKTTLVKLVAKNLGFNDTITSPSFNILKVYQNNDLELVHMDAYRIANQSTEEFDDYIYDKNRIMFIEWASLININVKAIKILLSINNDKRNIEVIW